MRHKGVRGLDVMSINDNTTRFETQVMACKLLRKFHRDQVPAGEITSTKKCAT